MKLFIAILVTLLDMYMAADKACPFKPLDLVFVLDGSGSMGSDNFRKQLNFIANFTKQFEIGPNHTQVALVTFATNVQNVFDLNRYLNKSDVLAGIAKAPYLNGETNTHLGLSLVKDHTLLAANGGNRNVTKLIIVLTDGRSLDPDALQAVAFALKQNPLVTVMAIGIGDNIDNAELLMIATDKNHTYLVNTFDALHTVNTELIDMACYACNNALTDVCFVLDSSGSEGALNFAKQLNFVNMIVNEFDFDHRYDQNGINPSRFCLVTFSTSASTEIRLNSFHSKEEIMQNVLKVLYRDGESNLHLGLSDARNELSTRPLNSTKVAIILTDGRSTEPTDTVHEANILHNNGVQTFAIGIGQNVDRNELGLIASDQNHVFQVNSFDQLDSIHRQVVNQICSQSLHATTTASTTKTTTTATTTTRTTTRTTMRTTTRTTTMPSTTTKAACGLKPADIVFLLDSSDSEGQDNFHKELEFVHSFASQFNIGPNNVQFSVVTFSSDVRCDFYFTNYTTRQQVLHAIQNVAYMGKGTNTSSALKFVRENNLSPKYGARINSTKIVIVITDGKPDNPVETQKEANLLKQYAEVIGIGVGPQINQTELAAISSNHRVFTVENFLLLQSLQKQLTDTACRNS